MYFYNELPDSPEPLSGGVEKEGGGHTGDDDVDHVEHKPRHLHHVSLLQYLSTISTVSTVFTISTISTVSTISTESTISTVSVTRSTRLPVLAPTPIQRSATSSMRSQAERPSESRWGKARAGNISRQRFSRIEITASTNTPRQTNIKILCDGEVNFWRHF